MNLAWSKPKSCGMEKTPPSRCSEKGVLVTERHQTFDFRLSANPLVKSEDKQYDLQYLTVKREISRYLGTCKITELLNGTELLKGTEKERVAVRNRESADGMHPVLPSLPNYKTRVIHQWEYLHCLHTRGSGAPVESPLML